ncbi:tagatose-bisphosphate aldolase noncatalytic subunit [Fulvimarina manganoxydans]|uniref:Tagatose-bisphosphate aldolase noncatalytic subunit n=1 Tax=Fulvimarina manganoxydans TaxID=937218 RepID=A0A1W2DGE4_9HYPH|nr:D-tagatose-bisphosphate aldolase, class II, non-catalytic subunit [Fulvimarina manganoxydans]SMC96577.1 tagatose-bisphosphate aldolase noncatalytic subunit [Fulvimarina manganoxydans]
MTQILDNLAKARREGVHRGITSVCSAHPVVLRAALRHARQHEVPVLIEATCNQVNHRGGYTGMQPADFLSLVRRIAVDEACPSNQIIFGGDHLGPNPWRHLPAEAALAEAEKMVAAYAAAGFSKLHLDCSMGCEGEPVALDDHITAERAARLASIADNAAQKAGHALPRFVIGTEVPPPGGADHVLDAVTPTAPSAARETIAIHRDVFQTMGIADAFERVVAVVVQPGVEFGNENVVVYDPAEAADLSRILTHEPSLVFEAHSTDYQGAKPLSALVRDGFSILKVGPELTFVLREALYGLDLIASDLVDGYGDRPLKRTMEAVMQASPDHWRRHYRGSEAETAMLRHYSLSDRIRYYWSAPQAEDAVGRLTQALSGRRLPLPLLRQHMPGAAHFADTPIDPEDILIWRVTRSLETYHAATRPGTRPDKP